jgi:hypothetical protein
MAVVIGVIVAVVIIGALFIGVRSFRGPLASTPETVPVRQEGDTAVIVVDLAGADPASPAAQRIIDDIAVHAFASIRDVSSVEVRDPSGAVLGVRHRVTTVPGPPPDLPRDLLEPHHDPRHSALVTPDERPDLAHPHFVTDDPPRRPLAERFQLPARVRERIRNPDDCVDLVAAILGAAGQDVTVDGNILRRGNDVVIVLANRLGVPVPPEDLNHAFRLFEREHARRGIVVTAGHLDHKDVQRRETLAPSLLHTGPDGIQRMADAAELGLDPLRFAIPVHLAVQR